ncbi:MAG TPA: hypothetical protein VFY10_06085 [Dehalococcoidia bacterium]|jgi:hypothetical protein|nr:hypothetical protein [Dehalococcoidia bacterium]
MDTYTIVGIVIAVVAVVIVASLAFALFGRHRTNALKDRYGSEYDRTVKKQGRRKAEQELSDRARRVEELDIRDLTPDEREDFSRQWTKLQAQFVDAPRTALQYADLLVQQVMTSRGYPMADFEQRAANISVDHASLVTDYRAAHAISARADSANTEQMRQAMLHYRSMFSELLGTGGTPTTETVAATTP